MLNIYTKEINGIKYTYSCDEQLSVLMTPIFRVIEQVPPEKIEDGIRIEAGFSIFILSKRQDGYVIITLDYDADDPLKSFTADLTEAFKIECTQANMLKLVEAESGGMRANNAVYIEKGALEHERMVMRKQPYEKFSRWELAKFDLDENGKMIIEPHPDYEPVAACKLVKRFPDLADTLALPDNYIVTFKDGKIEAIITDENKLIKFQ